MHENLHKNVNENENLQKNVNENMLSFTFLCKFSRVYMKVCVCVCATNYITYCVLWAKVIWRQGYKSHPTGWRTWGLILQPLVYETGPCSTVGNMFDCRYVSDCRSRGRELDASQVHTFVEFDHEIISTAILLTSPDSRRVNVSYKR